jgi:hypothetical protein
LSRVELWPWGGVDDRARDASRPSGAYPSGCPDLGHFTPTSELRSPEVYAQRDLEMEPWLCRLRSLLSIEEAAALWRLPVVPAGGQAGLASRLPNPFEQLPAESPERPGTINLGQVQHRGRSTSQAYRLPLLGGGGQTGIGDRVIVVAGSPGSGKTNFTINFLEQLWDGRVPDGNRIPYLVIDPTRGKEFRYLLGAAADDLVVFTVGDERSVPFCFNPFIVPRNVSLQAHISRLMSCFRAAYFMWDPLPAIFEEAIRLAYQNRFRQRGLKWEPTRTFGTGQPEDYPTLADLCSAMGRGEPGEKDTVLARQRHLWSADGQGTENQATIVASTSLRLENLRDNFEHIIGGAAPGRPCVDLYRLLEVPAVLELGLIGDSQALSLVMGFLVVSLAGCIENRNRQVNPLHVLVLEEAHRLLSAEGTSNQEGGNSKAQAADDLNNLLAEFRKYGQGVMLLDQRPGSLVGGVIDNAYLVALHRLNERKSFDQFVDMLNLLPQQQRFARVGLQPGETIILDRASGMPVLLRPEVKPKEDGHWQDDDWLRRRTRPLVERLYHGTAASAAQDDLYTRCRRDPDLAAKLDYLVAHLRGDSANARRVSSLARDLLAGLGVPRPGWNEAAKELTRRAGQEAGMTADDLKRLMEGQDDGEGRR